MSLRHQARETATRRSKFQPHVFVATVGALAKVGPARRGVDMVAADTVERRLPPLALKPAVIAAVVVQPEPEEKQAHERAKDDRAGGEIEHAPQQTQFGRRLTQIVTGGIRPSRGVVPIARHLGVSTDVNPGTARTRGPALQSEKGETPMPLGTW